MATSYEQCVLRTWPPLLSTIELCVDMVQRGVIQDRHVCARTPQVVRQVGLGVPNLILRVRNPQYVHELAGRL